MRNCIVLKNMSIKKVEKVKSMKGKVEFGMAAGGIRHYKR